MSHIFSDGAVMMCVFQIITLFSFSFYHGYVKSFKFAVTVICLSYDISRDFLILITVSALFPESDR